MIDYQEPIKLPVIDKAPTTDSTRKNEDMDIIPTYVETDTPINNKSLLEEYDSITEEDIRERFEKRITSKSYEGLIIPNDTQEKQDIFEKNVVITIDDCYNNEHTRDIFETLKNNNVTGTFFPNTTYLDINNEETVRLWREIYEEGFEIGYHTTTHKQGMSKEELDSDFQRFTEYMRELLRDPSFSIKVVRPPYGLWDNEWNRWVEENNLFNIRWNMGPGNSSDYARVLINKNISPIIILHSRWEDANWIKNNIDELKTITDENNSVVGSVYDSIPQKKTTLKHGHPVSPMHMLE